MTLWSRLKIHFRIKPWGAAWACTACSWVAMLLLLRLPLGQPFVKLFLTDNLHDSVHLVVPQAAKLRAGKLEFAGLNGGEMHVNRDREHPRRRGMRLPIQGAWRQIFRRAPRTGNTRQTACR